MIKKLCFASLFTSSILIANPATPESLIPDGTDRTSFTNPFNGIQGEARKGTIGSTIINVARLNQLLDQKEMTDEERDEFQAICLIEKNLIESLNVLGMFDLFSPEEWLNSDIMPGRIYVIMLYLQTHPEQITPEMKKQLEHIAATAKSSFVKELAAQL